MLFFNKKNFLTIAVCCLFSAYAVEAVTKLKVFNKTTKTISIELFKVVQHKNSNKLSLKLLNKSTIDDKKYFAKDKLINNATYLIKIFSDWDNLKRSLIEANGKFHLNLQGQEYLKKLDLEIMNNEHYFVFKTVKGQIVHLDFKYRPEDKDFDVNAILDSTFSMRPIKNNVPSDKIQSWIGQSRTKDITMEEIHIPLIDQIKIVFFHDEINGDISYTTAYWENQLKKHMRSVKNEMEDLKSKISTTNNNQFEINTSIVTSGIDKEQRCSKNHNQKETEKIKIAKKASMKLLLQDNFTAENAATNFSNVLTELKEFNSKQ